MYIYLNRSDIALSEYNFTLNFFLVVIEKLGLKVGYVYGVLSFFITWFIFYLYKLITKNSILTVLIVRITI